MTNASFSFQKTYHLKQHTPLIHFQSAQSGATLRATEVKPKLDRYLLRIVGGKQNVDPRWLLDAEHEALNYRMCITCAASQTVDLGQESYQIYYGNTGKAKQNPKKGVTCSDVTLTITCLQPTLLQLIDDCIGDFFIAENFGTMQDKGFGSFTVDGKDNSPSHIAGVLTRQYDARKCYRYLGGGTPFKTVKTIYGIIKSGVNTSYFTNGNYQRSLLFLFMHNKYGIGNEKAYVKQKGIAPVVGHKDTIFSDHKSYYVRAAFGFGGSLRFTVPSSCSRQVTIESIDKNVERIPSIILFKIIDSYVYFIAKRCNDAVFNKEFKFSSTTGSGTLKTPTRAELGTTFEDDFLDFCYHCFTGDYEKSDPLYANVTDTPILAKFSETRGVRIEEVNTDE